MVGRYYEVGRLKESLKSEDSELVAVYGRRRVGKTYLIRNILTDHMVFEFTGLNGANRGEQIKVFFKQLETVSKRMKNNPIPSDWGDAFDLLKTYIKGLRSKGKKVIFIDELPWLDTHKSGFLMHLGHFWNTFCEKRKDILLVVCGSAASYMVQKIVSNKGSLHARLTYKLLLKPFTLAETREYLKSKNIHWDSYSIIQLYIALGGIPHYLSKVKKGQSVVQNIQRLCFDTNGDLQNEFNEIFESLFAHSATHKQIVKTLATCNKGISRNELIANTGYSGGGHFTKALEELVVSGFVSDYPALSKKSKMTLYRLSDEFSRFYLKYMEPNKKQGKNFWKTLSQSQSYLSWSGFNFETICLKHVDQIKRAMGIEGIHSVNSSWQSNKAQIDLVIDRDDRWINIFEIKFSSGEYKIGKEELLNYRNKLANFKEVTKTRKNIALIMLSTFGVEQNENFYAIAESQFNMEVLFG